VKFEKEPQRPLLECVQFDVGFFGDSALNYLTLADLKQDLHLEADPLTPNDHSTNHLAEAAGGARTCGA